MSKLGDNYYVVRRDDGWAVRREGADRVSSEHNTQKEAVARGRELAQAQGGELRIQGRDHKFLDSDSFGHDPNPPRDRKH